MIHPQSSVISTSFLNFGLCALAPMLFGLLVLGEMRFSLWHLSENLDVSWIASVANAKNQNVHFGSDIAFTVGPAFQAMYRIFDRFMSPISLFAPIYYAVISCYFLFTVRRRLTFFIASSLLVPFLISPLLIDGLQLFLIVFMVSVMLSRLRHGYIDTILLAFFCALSFLTKFSFLAIILPALLAVDISAVVRRRLPAGLLMFAAAVAGLWVLYDQPIATLPGYFHSGMMVASGYSEAMTLWTSGAEIIVWILLAMLYAGIIIAKAIDVCKCELWLIVFVQACALFLAAKHGFVRHDGHALIAWTLLLLLFATYPIIFGRFSGPSLIITASALSVVMMVLCSFSASIHMGFDYVQMRLGSAITQVGDVGSFLLNRNEWVARHLSTERRQEQVYSSEYLKENVTGTIDVISNDQYLALASGLDLRSRPTIQEHGAYSPSLIARNAAFFLGSRAPDFLLFAPGSIDDRHPASAEGANWPIIFSRYRVAGQNDRHLLLAKREAVKSTPLLEVLANVKVGFGQRLDLPEPEAYGLVIRAKIAYSTLGRLIFFLFKAPTVFLTSFADRRDIEHRILPGQISEGMLVSPYVGSASDMLRFLEQQGERQIVSAIQFGIPPWAAPLFHHSIEVEVLSWRP